MLGVGSGVSPIHPLLGCLAAYCPPGGAASPQILTKDGQAIPSYLSLFESYREGERGESSPVHCSGRACAQPQPGASFGSPTWAQELKTLVRP